MSSVQLLSLGIIGEYLARIFQEVKGRPTFLIARIEEQKTEAKAEGNAEARVEDRESKIAG
jgi:hypothetical protein